MIKVTVYTETETLDLEISSTIKVSKLKAEIERIFAIEKNFVLKVMNKKQLLEDDLKLSDYDVTSGDILVVQSEVNYANS